MDIDPSSDEGHKYWMNEISQGKTRGEILKYFKDVAQKENGKSGATSLEDYLDGDSPEGRIAVVMPESAGDVLWANSLISNLKELYPEHDIYFITKPKFYPMIEDNENVHRVLPYSPGLDSLTFLEGRVDHKGYFEIAYLPHIGTQKILSYPHNGKDKNTFDLMP